MSRIIDHPTHEGMWRHDPPIPKPCWVCGFDTVWIELDLSYQHAECSHDPGYRMVLGDVVEDNDEVMW